MQTASSSQPKSHKVTPMMAQWHQCKRLAKDAILLFRMGDFYEAFYDDAVLICEKINLTLTQRQGIPMCGVPVQNLDTYVDKLLLEGLKVGIAEQTEDPKQSKGLVKRELVRIVSRGTSSSQQLVADKSNHYFLSLEQVGSIFGMAILDLTTGQFEVVEFDQVATLINETYRLAPVEVLCSEKFCQNNHELIQGLKQDLNFLLTKTDDYFYDHEPAFKHLQNHFRLHSLDGFGLKGMVAGINAAGALLIYLEQNLKTSLKHVHQIGTYKLNDFLSIDHSTQKHLELTENNRDGSKAFTLLSVLDYTQTAMGGRLIRKWIKQPLLSQEKITFRQDAIEALMQNCAEHEEIMLMLKPIKDLERIVARLSSNLAGPRDLLALKHSIKELPYIKSLCQHLPATLIQTLLDSIKDLRPLSAYLEQAVKEEVPLRISDGAFIKKGFHQELDELLDIRSNNKTFLLNYQNQLRESTQIKTLKVSYNRVFGYYIEVSKGQAQNMPAEFIRRQTLVNNERFISPELKVYEEKVLTAEDKISKLEAELFEEIRQSILKQETDLLTTSSAIAQIDCLCSLAHSAIIHNYTRPQLVEKSILEIDEGRHPVLETLTHKEHFIPNSTQMDDKNNKLFIITGPNMAGKSTYLRQVALIVIIAQMGSFVPAKKAKLGIIDKVFSRIGASDDLARGQSTFMVEMNETANILNNVTDNSLVILDEIGRGTSTYDGISIAWAVAEYLLTTQGKSPKTLFATHYWELTQLEKTLSGAVNYSVAVKEWNDEIVFLHKIVRGGTDKSYGIQVARLAGLPKAAIKKAKEVLGNLEESRSEHSFPTHTETNKQNAHKQEVQYLLFSQNKAEVSSCAHRTLIEQIKNLDLNVLSPLEALNFLSQVKDKLNN